MWPWTRRDQGADDRKSLDALAEFFAAASGTANKIAVSPARALEVVPVRAAVQLRCQTLSSLPLRLFRRLPDGGKEKADDHPLYPLLHGQANAWTSSTDFIASLERDTLLDGHGYALANRISGDRVAELISISPDKVKVETSDADEPSYVVSLKGCGNLPAARRRLCARNLADRPRGEGDQEGWRFRPDQDGRAEAAPGSGDDVARTGHDRPARLGARVEPRCACACRLLPAHRKRGRG